MKIVIHPIAKRNKYNCTDDLLINRAITSHSFWTPGDKPGVFHCVIPVSWVKGEIKTLSSGDVFNCVATYSSRPGVVEEPRLSFKAKAAPDPVESADCIIYSHELLGKDASVEDSDYEIIVVRGMAEKPNPRTLSTLLHDVFEMSGGTPCAGWSDSQKLEAIKESFLFWRDKIMVE
jgi:hypothetical protein